MMSYKKPLIKFSIFIFIFVSKSIVSAQTTTVTGIITDTLYNKPMSFVGVFVPGTKTTTVSNLNGKYTISSSTPFTQIKVTFMGYKDAVYAVEAGKSQEINIKMISVSKQLNEVVIGSDKFKYRNKDNPAVAIIQKVIENKEKNQPQIYPYVEFREYDKIMFLFDNIPEKISDKKPFSQYKFLFKNRDTTTVPGKSLLPVYLNEKLSQYYYQKNPEKETTIPLGDKTVNFGNDIDSDGLNGYLKYLFYKVDIYSNSILLMTNNFLSPIANTAPTFYKYFITDTITKDSVKLVELSFTPRNTTDLLFAGKLYITLDGNYAVQKALLTINKNINLNFVESLAVELEFGQNPDGRYHLINSRTLADMGLNKNALNLWGTRTVIYNNFEINRPRPDSTYKKNDVALSERAKLKSDEFWAHNRPEPLSPVEAKTYKNVDSLMHMPSFKLTVDIATILLGGYKNFGPVEFGPTGTFYSFNPVEGFRLQFGGRTTTEFNTRYYFEGYAAYGFKDERWKYFFSTAYSFNNKSVYKFPLNYVKASIQNDITIPGQGLQVNGQNNVLLSFKRGNNLQYLYDQKYTLDYVHEYENHFSYKIGINRLTQSPAGSLYFTDTYNNTVQNINKLTTTEFTAGLRFAPHEQFYQGKVFRSRIVNKYPVLSINYSQGVKNLWHGQYNYQKLVADIDKHFYLSQFGYADVNIEAGHLFGQVPYPLLNILPANETYLFDTYAYNLMNFLEFVTDHYESVKIDQHFNGFFLNKIPLFKKLKWREVVSFKAIWGGLSDENNPLLHPALYQFPVTSGGQPITYALGNTAYEEGSLGVENIFKIIRLDYVKRFNYLDHPDVAKSGVRVSAQLNF